MHDERKFIKHFEQRCRDMYIQDGFNDIQSRSRCRMYKEIKQVHNSELRTQNSELRILFNITMKIYKYSQE